MFCKLKLLIIKIFNLLLWLGDTIYINNILQYMQFINNI